MSHKSYQSKRETFTFDLGDGSPTFTARGGFGSMVLELGELAKLRDLQADSPEGIAAIAVIFKMLLGDTEYEAFRTYVSDHGVDQDVLLALVQDMFVAVVGHPLGQPPASSPGPPTAPRTYKVISPSDGTVTEGELTPEKEAELIAAMEKDLIPGSD